MDVDVLLKIWAVIGPLGAAAASSIWLRRNQVADRQYSEQIQQKLRSEQLEREESERLRIEKQSHYCEAKNLLSSFLSATYQYVSKETDRLRIGTPDSQKVAREAFDKFSEASSLIFVSIDGDLSQIAIKVWNCAIAMPVASAKAMNDKSHKAEFDAVAKDYMEARAEFSTAAKKYLDSLR